MGCAMLARCAKVRGTMIANLRRVHYAESTMTLPATAMPSQAPPAFLGVTQSLTGKLWRDRLDARGSAQWDQFLSVNPLAPVRLQCCNGALDQRQ